ncbi:hypothetical protein EVAR_2991_1 [Eumeta japonica]|uniref:Uncharacterized protein n=1 Tax=Eumeta variegata TaxID=151549 RepID=A0A4C1SU95_EUMVA|nr:hypothetical protein EVAR_2991_1 [Eumeta japonica]
MSKSKKSCCMNSTKRKPCCEHAKMVDCKDVAEIVEALTTEAADTRRVESGNRRTSYAITLGPGLPYGFLGFSPGPRGFKGPSAKSKQRTKKIGKQQKSKIKQCAYVPRPHRDVCVPMTPAMHTRLRFISHCPPESAKFDSSVRAHDDNCSCLSSSAEDFKERFLDGGGKDVYEKKVRYCEIQPEDALLPMSKPVVKHTDSDACIITVASPKTSGEVVAVARAPVETDEFRPPLPPKSGHAVFKPHSGIVINKNDEFSPDFDTDIGKEKGDDKKKPMSCGKKHGGGGDGPREKKPMRPEDSVCGPEDIPELDHVDIYSY